MHYAHTDLLSYDDIDRDVDRLFRVFCDTALIEFASNKKDTRDYWANVRAFRRVHLTPFERLDLIERATGTKKPLEDFEAVEESENEASGDETSAHARDFIYWFDVRAEHWSTHGADQELLNTLVPSQQLSALYNEAKKVQKRIHDAQEVAAVVEWSAKGSSSTNALVVTKVIKTPSVYPEEG